MNNLPEKVLPTGELAEPPKLDESIRNIVTITAKPHEIIGEQDGIVPHGSIRPMPPIAGGATSIQENDRPVNPLKLRKVSKWLSLRDKMLRDKQGL